MNTQQAVGVPLSSVALDSAELVAHVYARTEAPGPRTVGLLADSGTLRVNVLG